MRIDLKILVAVPLAVLFACGSPDESEQSTADATTGAESNGGDTAGASAEAGRAGTSSAGASSAGSHSGASGAGTHAGAPGAGTHAGASGAGMSGANASGAGAPSAGASGAGAGAAGASAGAAGDASSATCDPSCPDGQRCELVQVMCIRAPCPPLPMCRAASAAATSCDPAKILCKRAVPECPQGQVPSVEGSCYGPCIPVESCGCSKESECPDHDHYTCHMSAKHCGPYV
jgi:hypothetical protein